MQVRNSQTSTTVPEHFIQADCNLAFNQPLFLGPLQIRVACALFRGLDGEMQRGSLGSQPVKKEQGLCDILLESCTLKMVSYEVFMKQRVWADVKLN